jgi:hypothetical protein
MPIPLLIGAGAGLVSAALFASAATATALAGILFYLAPLPLCLAGLGWGTAAALLGTVTGTVAIAVVLGPATGAFFALSIGAPVAVLCYLALLSRPVRMGAGQSTLEWYPPGRLVGWAAVIAGLLAAAMVLMLGYDADSYRESIGKILNQSSLKELDPDGSLFNEETITRLSAVLARVLPAAFAVVWLSIMLFNLWLAGLIVQASGRALRPWPELDTLELPTSSFLLFVGALALSLLPGLPGLLATGLAGALLFSYVLQGLAVLHVWSRGLPLRGLLLTAVYLGILLLGWVALGVAALGLSEPMLRLRERAAMRGRPPNTE